MEIINPVDYVAPEIWATIFDKLQNFESYNTHDRIFSYSRDTLNCSRVCLTFKNILEHTKCQWLFPEVLPLLFPHLTGEELLCCRQVCVIWNRSVNCFLENEQQHLRRHLASQRNHCDWRNRGSNSEILPASLLPLDHPWNANIFEATYSFSKSVNIIGFVGDMGGYDRNPFPGKTLRLKYQSNYASIVNNNRNEEYDRHNQFWSTNVPQLLVRFGEHLSVLEIFIDFNPRFSPANFYTLLKLNLEMTPNLRRLIFRSVSCPDMNASMASDLTTDILNFCNDKMPDLEYLESLEFSPGTKFLEYSSLPLSIQQRIGNPYLGQLKRLHISFADGAGLIPLWQPNSMPNLEELKVELFSATQLNSVLPEDSYFEKLKSVTIIITAYYDVSLLSSQRNECQWQPQLGEFLRPLNKYKNSLQELVLDADRSPWGVASQKDMDELRGFVGLKYLYISNFWFPQLRVLECIPWSVKLLRLSGYFSCGYHRIFRKLHIPADLLSLQEKL